MTYGLMVLAINLGYLLFAIVTGILLTKLLCKYPLFAKLPKVLLGTLLILGIALAPFYDLLIQKGIKTYYELFKMQEQIYAYPEKDSEGRVESLGLDKGYTTRAAGYLSAAKDFKNFKKIFKVRDFIELYMTDTFIIKDKKVRENNQKDMGYTRVYLNKSEIKYEKIVNAEAFNSRYQVLTTVNIHRFYIEKIVSFWDKKKNKLLAKGLKVSFPVKNEKNKFRYRFLHWQGANGKGISIENIHNMKKNYLKFF